MQKIGSHGYMRRTYRSRAYSKKHSIWLILFAVGMIGGIIASVMHVNVNDAHFYEVTSYLDHIKNAEWILHNNFMHVCLTRAIEVMALGGIIYMFHTPLLFCVITLALGGMFGYVLAVLAMIYGLKACIIIPGLMLPQYLFYIPIYIIFIKISEKRLLYENKYAMINGGHKIATILVSVVFIMVLTGILAESYVNPLFVKKIVKIF